MSRVHNEAIRRPLTIRWFGVFATISFVFAAIKIAKWWPATFDVIRSFMHARGPSVDEISHAGRIVGLAINILLVIFIMRRRNQAAARIFVGLTAIWVSVVAIQFLSDTLVVSDNLIGLATITTQAIAAGLLLMKASRTWFGYQSVDRAVFE